MSEKKSEKKDYKRNYNGKSKIYSHSRISTFEQCPLKFKFRYIDKIIPEIEKTIETHLGSAVHETLEWIYNQKQKGETPTLDDAIMHYTKTWRKDFSEEIVIVKDHLNKKDYYNKGVEFIANYYKTNHPFEDGTEEIEKKIFLELDKDGKYKIIGFIDRLAKNPETGHIEIHDYKTANTLPSKEKINNDRQLALYAMAIKEKRGYDKKVTLNWHYLAHNKKITIKKTNEELKQLKNQTLDKIKKIESTKKFPPKKSILCKWCSYQKECKKYHKKQAKSNREKEKTNIKQENKLYKDKYPTISKYIKD